MIRGILCTILFTFSCSLWAGDFVWLEGENPSQTPNLKQVDGVEKLRGGNGFGYEAWGNSDVMSGGKLLHVTIGAKDVDKYLPDDYIFSYDFQIEKAGKQNVWARIGYEWARSKFQWRIDKQAWQTVERDAVTANVQPIQTWNELGWLKLATQNLSAGKHRIEFKHNKVPGKKGTERILHMLDAIFITADDTVPVGKYRPGQDHQSAKDREAAEHVFAVNVAESPKRTETVLNGMWTTAGWDEFPVDEAKRLGPVKELPDLNSLRWFAYKAPGDRDRQLPALSMTHRYLLRAKLNVPASLKGRGFFLDVQRSNLICSVFVNGKFMDWTKTFHTAWQLDLTPGIVPGKVNDLVIVVKDAYYSLNPKGDKRAEEIGNRRYWNIPRDFLIDNQGIAGRHDMPCAADVRTGILEPATLVVSGPIYTTDVFAMPSVKNKKLDLELSVLNPGKTAQTIELRNRIVPWNKGKGGAVELTLPAQKVRLNGGESKTVKLGKSWANPHLWWPDDPFLYWVVTDMVVDGKVVDTKRTRFGFRAWDWSTHMFLLNGIKWPMWADVNYTKTPQSFVELTKRSNMNQIRYWRSGGWGDMTRREVLNYMDETGVLVRSSGTFDGQRANYGGGLRETGPDGEKRAKKRLFDNWNEQMAAWVKEERNHPSIYIWSVENEITYINVNNLGQAKEVEPAIRRGVEHVMSVDPTRPAMVDGGNCLRDESLPVNGAHYTEFMNSSWRDFPDKAYTREHFYDKDRPQRGAWRMVPGRPIMKGEVYFANGYGTEKFGAIGGDKCFVGYGQTMEARGLWAKMLTEGYRWAEVSSFHFWLGSAQRQYWNSWSPVAVFCRQWNWTFGEQTKVSRTCRVFNSTRHSDPIEVTWEFRVGGRKVAGASKSYQVKPGEAEEFVISFTTPAVATRTDARFILSAKRNGKEVFREEKKAAVIAPQRIAKPKVAKGDIAVFDPAGTVKQYLRKRGIPFTEIRQYDQVPKSSKVIILGKDAVPAKKQTDTRWYSMATSGKRIIVLDQKNPLHMKAIPADLKATDYTGRMGFCEDFTHPIFADMKQMDFFTWGNDHVLYRNAYHKGNKGGRSLVQCDEKLAYTALVESQVENGLLLLSQLAIGAKLNDTGVAQQIFNNMLNYAVDYTPIRKKSLVAIAADSEKLKLLESLNLSYDTTGDPVAALKDEHVAIVDATPQNLKKLLANKDKVDRFCRNGGWLMLWNVGPDGLQHFNKLVEHNHVMRKFRKERVVLNMPVDSLASGLTLRDVVMDTGKKMYRWMALKEPDQQAFTHLVDHTDIAPFCEFPTPMELGKATNTPGVDHWPRNMVNGFTSDDNWAFTYTVIMDKGHKRKFTLELPKEEELIALKIRPSKIYHPITKMKIYFDDDPTPVVAEIPVREQPVTEEIPVPGRKARKITLEIAEWAERGKKNIVVIDNLWLQVKRSPEYMENVSSLLNVGGLMRYDIGKGGIFLNQLNILPREKNPVNTTKKATIVRTILGNMGAIFAGSKTVVAGAGLAYKPLRIPDGDFNAYVHHKGKPSWFKGPGDLEAMPVGNQTLNNVDFFLSDFSTSPVPSVFMLGCRSNDVKTQEITGINVGTKIDGLFFLHTFHPERPIQDWERKVAREMNKKEKRRNVPAPPVVFHYVIHYADGSSVKVPVTYAKDIGPWYEAEPKAFANAPIAWVGELPKARKGEKSIVYTMQWNNPSPDKAVKSIDIVGKDKGKHGAPAVFAITAARVVE